jgi:hypothetical protein
MSSMTEMLKKILNEKQNYYKQLQVDKSQIINIIK